MPSLTAAPVRRAGVVAVLAAALAVTLTLLLTLPAAAATRGQAFGPDEADAFDAALDDLGVGADLTADFENARTGGGLLGRLLPGPALLDDPLNSETNRDVFRAGAIPAGITFQSNAAAVGTDVPRSVARTPCRSGARTRPGGR